MASEETLSMVAVSVAEGLLSDLRKKLAEYQAIKASTTASKEAVDAALAAVKEHQAAIEATIEANVPAHEADGSRFRLRNPDGTWGEWVDAKGLSAYQLAVSGGFSGTLSEWLATLVGEPGPVPSHQWSGTSIRFQSSGNSWGEYVDLKGAQGDKGDKGDKGDTGITDASLLTTGTLADARLPARLGVGSKQTADWNTAVESGWYWSFQGANQPMAGNVFVGTVHCISPGVVRIEQEVSAVNLDPSVASIRYIRTSNNAGATWSDWVPVIHTQPALDARYAQLSGTREKLTASRTYYVRTDGSDSNDGLSNTSGGAFLTIGKAVDVMESLDAGIYNVTISVADGTYAENVSVSGPLIGTGLFKIQGNTTTPANVVVNRIWASRGAVVTVDGFRLTSTNGLRALDGGTKLTIDNVSLAGAVAMSSEVGGLIYGVYADINIESTVSTAIAQAVNGTIDLFAATIAVDGNAWSAAGAFYTVNLSYVRIQGVTFTGSATGKRYVVNTNSVLNTGGGGESFIPGDAAGTTFSGGQYA